MKKYITGKLLSKKTKIKGYINECVRRGKDFLCKKDTSAINRKQKRLWVEICRKLIEIYKNCKGRR